MTAVRPTRRRQHSKRPHCRSLSFSGASGEPGNFARDKRPARFAPVGGSVALKLEFFAHSIDVSMPERIMRQARTWPRPCANGVVPLCGSDDSVFKVQCPPWPLAGADGLSRTVRYVCFSGDDRGSVRESRRSPRASHFRSNATFHASNPLVSSGFFESSSASNATVFRDSPEKAPSPPA